jgi:hypothetical protein
MLRPRCGRRRAVQSSGGYRPGRLGLFLVGPTLVIALVIVIPSVEWKFLVGGYCATMWLWLVVNRHDRIRPSDGGYDYVPPLFPIKPAEGPQAWWSDRR